ncbi:MAG: aminotransferase class IV, partial [Acidobacteria bacterium]|nr:aminotransferase class IV [Acidobacteriota bacterium]
RQLGFDEAIRVNERGIVTSGTMTNVFWSKGGRLFTPDLKTGCLPGTTREFVLENLEVKEVEAAIDELKGADAIYLTSAGLGVIAVDEFDGREFPQIEHPITGQLA